MSLAYRIVLLQSLCIPTDDRDPDQDSYERSYVPPPAPLDPLGEARAAVAGAWTANRGAVDTEQIEKDFTDWSSGEVFMDAPAERLLTYADYLKQEARSEEHTSELQSLMRISYAVFCLKKKKAINNPHTHHTTMQ